MIFIKDFILSKDLIGSIVHLVVKTSKYLYLMGIVMGVNVFISIERLLKGRSDAPC